VNKTEIEQGKFPIPEDAGRKRCPECGQILFMVQPESSVGVQYLLVNKFGWYPHLCIRTKEKRNEPMIPERWRAARVRRARQKNSFLMILMPCEVCGEEDLAIIEIHHIIPMNYDSTKVLCRDAGEVVCLCANCHKKVHSTFGGVRNVKYTGPTNKKILIECIKKARWKFMYRKKFHEDIKKKIKHDYTSGVGSLRFLGRKYGVSHATISEIVKKT
jgi:hypothetical protein